MRYIKLTVVGVSKTFSQGIPRIEMLAKTRLLHRIERRNNKPLCSKKSNSRRVEVITVTISPILRGDDGLH